MKYIKKSLIIVISPAALIFAGVALASGHASTAVKSKMVSSLGHEFEFQFQHNALNHREGNRGSFKIGRLGSQKTVSSAHFDYPGSAALVEYRKNSASNEKEWGACVVIQRKDQKSTMPKKHIVHVVQTQSGTLNLQPQDSSTCCFPSNHLLHDCKLLQSDYRVHV